MRRHADADDPERLVPQRNHPLGELGPLFEAPVGYQRGSDTSRAAAESMEAEVTHLRRVVAELYQAVAPTGLTPDEAAERLGLSILSARPRTTELMQAGVLVDTGVRRANASGRMARVLRWSERGGPSDD